jgi:hypothetical protein
MGMLMIRCPKANRPIFTGRCLDSSTFRSTPVFFSRTYCPYCRVTHEWFAKDAWIDDCESFERETLPVGRIS